MLQGTFFENRQLFPKDPSFRLLPEYMIIAFMELACGPPKNHEKTSDTRKKGLSWNFTGPDGLSERWGMVC